jgi:hypothetical protein
MTSLVYAAGQYALLKESNVFKDMNIPMKDIVQVFKGHYVVNKQGELLDLVYSSTYDRFVVRSYDWKDHPFRAIKLVHGSNFSILLDGKQINILK